MAHVGEEQWLAVLREVRRQAKNVADASGVESLLEGEGKLYDADEPSWQVLPKLEEVLDEGVWQEQQWHNAFEFLFLETPERFKGGSQQDDLLFFVLHEHAQEGRGPLFVRRKRKALPSDLAFGGPNSLRVSWCKTVLLNLVLQTAFVLQAAVCTRDDLFAARDAADKDLPPGVIRAAGGVYASPSRLQVEGSQRESGPAANEAMVVAYPDICFAVDDADSGFGSLVLPEPGWCLQLQLLACRGIALHAQEEPAPGLQDSPSNDILQAAAEQRPPSRLPETGTGDTRFEVQRSQDAVVDTGGMVRGSDPLDIRWPEAEAPSKGAEARIGERMSAILGWEDDGSQEPSNGSNSLSEAIPVDALPEDLINKASASSRESDRLAPASKLREPPKEPHIQHALESEVAQPQAQSIFSGFVSYEQLADAIGDWQGGHRRKQGQHVVRMRGPGGQGHALVSVNWIPHEDSGHLLTAGRPKEPVQESTGSLLGRIGGGLKAAILSTAAAANMRISPTMRISCSMMEVCLPVELLASLILGVPLKQGSSD